VINGDGNQRAQHELSNEFGCGLHAFFVFFEDFDVIIDAADYAHPNGAHDHQNHIDVAEFCQ